MNKQVKIAWIGKHFGEEPPLVRGKGPESKGKKQGAGTIFFSGCNLRCVFCQNYQIPQQGLGRLISVEELANAMLDLHGQGAVNIDLVTPTLWADQIVAAVKIARGKGLCVPIVWNSNGYEKVSLIEALRGVVDIYLPDFKYADDTLAKKYSGVENYLETAKAAIRAMYEQVGNLQLDDQGIATRGLMVRHMVLPGLMANSIGVLNEMAQIDTMIYVSLMSQYSPVYRSAEFPEINRPITDEEMDQVYDYADFCGLKNGFRQKSDSARPMTPDFRKVNPFE
ncbi:hypothetical protein A2482_03580 [Candidatus Falkowbacteria bacterium RIFOXYC2_FULL_48_21]|uniref:Radical SAM core domain-containing protein n=1 Tax=Candidatus Falkowbacteria bacterium RIFOXYC2_FULL_48_21 TaxID=1798005 RepID=A0A1F5TC97_9BACT|nr:MAG: hypothetical protein A2482_03580 [Candidatus Falkowbacteria bacterium RIFOXYC2_FULL_48_21]